MNEVHTGRLIDHLHLRVADLAASAAFYGAVMEVLGIPYAADDHHFEADELWIDEGPEPSRCHLAFQASDQGMVRRFHEAALAAGGRDNGAPGERGYHPGYYACFVLDPDGNNIEAVHHGPHTRSAPSVVSTY